ncbi:anthrax toxin lethal factor-related metalloendopeptidase [Streptosporangium canum]|uniref:anthrax toxin lethal factor-related metalloendopeptidase n=1 Tax=Streptosporangium canum TaxID=324952 RepID=UPI0037946821
MANSPTWCLPQAASTHPIPRDGRRHCGVIERVLRRQWDPATGLPHADLIHAVDDLASLPVHIASRLAEGLDAIWIGSGNVPDLDNLGHLRGQPTHPGGALWDTIPGICTGRLIAIGTGPHVSASLVHHEIGHALDFMDQMSQGQEWHTIMRLCSPKLQQPRYRDSQIEWFAEAYALCISRQARRLLRMLDGDENLAAVVWNFFRRHYGI